MKTERSFYVVQVRVAGEWYDRCYPRTLEAAREELDSYRRRAAAPAPYVTLTPQDGRIVHRHTTTEEEEVEE